MTSPMTQLDLFAGSREICQLQTENAYLKERLETAKVSYRTLRDELQDVRAQVQQQQTLEHELHSARQEVELWRTLASLWRTQAETQTRLQPQHHARPGPSREDLTTLLFLAHPGKWQGQSAEVLAHELTVRINALRQGVTR